ncbi:hypothetical protein ACGK9U_03985 [Mariniflexile sp. HNIBRBA6329]|uniref:hypothetical protein n=1 Tax=Mariniflexile sp. HNIBRBA6329 TaxID=3373088 RepID=UPI00374690CF
MFSKSNLISTLVTTLWGFLGGWLIWGIIGDPILKEHISNADLMKEMPDMPLLALGCLIVGFAFSTMYSKWANSTHSAAIGATFGIWLGILTGLGDGLIDHATANIIDLSGTLINAVLYIIHFAIMGVLASLVYNKFSS